MVSGLALTGVLEGEQDAVVEPLPLFPAAQGGGRRDDLVAGPGAVRELVRKERPCTHYQATHKR